VHGSLLKNKLAYKNAYYFVKNTLTFAAAPTINKIRVAETTPKHWKPSAIAMATLRHDYMRRFYTSVGFVAA